MILHCQQIQERIMKKSNAAVMGVESGGDDGFDLDEDSISDDEDEEDEVAEEIRIAESLADGFGSRTQSRVPTPTNYGDVDGGIGIVAPEELPNHPVLTLQSATQQSAEGAIINAPLFPTQQPVFLISHNSGICFCPLMQQPISTNSSMSNMFVISKRAHYSLYVIYV
jgi:hypothetical protein